MITGQSNSVKQRIPTVRDAYNPPKKRRAVQVRSTYLPPGSLITDRADLAKTEVMQLVDADDILVNDVSLPLKTLINYRLKWGNSAAVRMTNRLLGNTTVTLFTSGGDQLKDVERPYHKP